MSGLVLIVENGLSGIDLNHEMERVSPLSRKSRKLGSDVLIEYYSNNKFSNDKLFDEDEDVFICTDGVFLGINSHEGRNDLFNKIKKDFLYDNSRFPLKYRGNHTGYIYDKKKNKHYLFTNFTNSKPYYYYCQDDVFIASSSFSFVVEELHRRGLKYSLSEKGSYYMLTFGYMIGQETIINEIKKSEPGSVLEYYNGKITTDIYYRIDNESYYNDKEDVLVEELHRRFSMAVTAQFDKDLEYNYSHIALLSGGLDSRAISFYAKLLDYDNVTNATFAQSNSLDYKIARRIAFDIGNDHVFKQLDGGMYLRNIEEVLKLNYGLVFYAGSSHALSFLKDLNWERFGLLHNGNLADIMHGDYIDGKKHTGADVSRWATSRKLMSRISDEAQAAADSYGNAEKFAIYNRGMNAVLNGNFMAQDFTETAEPFLYFDVVDFSSHFPPKFKYKEYSFIRMLNTYVPGATKYIWEKYLSRPTMFNRVLFQNKTYSFVLRGVKYIDRKYLNFNGKSSMNPFDYWYSANVLLREYIQTNYEKRIGLLDKYTELKKDTVFLFDNGNFMEKSLVLTLLYSVEKYFNI